MNFPENAAIHQLQMDLKDVSVFVDIPFEYNYFQWITMHNICDQLLSWQMELNQDTGRKFMSFVRCFLLILFFFFFFFIFELSMEYLETGTIVDCLHIKAALFEFKKRQFIFNKHKTR